MTGYFNGRGGTILALLLGAFTVFAGANLAQSHDDEHKMTLRAIMRELGAEYLRLTNTLLTGDTKGMEESAKAIKDHPFPEEIEAAIKSKLGKDFHAFERADEQTHKAASDLSGRAAAKDVSGSAKAFGRLAESCVSCHKRFRDTLRPLSD